MTVGAGDLYCLRKIRGPPGACAAYEMAIAPGPNTFATRYPRITSPTFSFFATPIPGFAARRSEHGGQSATVSADFDTLAASCLSVVRKWAGSAVNFCSASCGDSPSYSTTSHSDLSI